MAATLRELRGRIRSAGSIKKITKAQELIATSRIAKAQARVEAARPYSTEITNMLTELASASALDHPLLVPRENPRRAAVLVVSSDRGLCGAYNANVLRQSEELFSLLREEGKDFTAAHLRAYRTALEESFVMKDLKKYRDMPGILHHNRQFLTTYPELLTRAADTFLKVDGVDKRTKEKTIKRDFITRRSRFGLVSDAIKLVRAFR